MRYLKVAGNAWRIAIASLVPLIAVVTLAGPISGADARWKEDAECTPDHVVCPKEDVP